MQGFNFKNLESSSEIFKQEKQNFKNNFIGIIASTFLLLAISIFQVIKAIIDAITVSSKGIPADLAAKNIDKSTFWTGSFFPILFVLIIIWILIRLFLSYKEVNAKQDFRLIRGFGFYFIFLVFSAITIFLNITVAKAYFAGETPPLDSITFFPSWVSIITNAIDFFLIIIIWFVFVKNFKKIIIKFSIAKSSEDMKIFMDANKDMFKDPMFPFGAAANPNANAQNENKTAEEVKQHEQNMSAEQKKRAINEEKLNNLTLGELRALAKKQHIFGGESMNRRELIDTLLNSIDQ